MLATLREATVGPGFELRERLAVYPEYIVGDAGVSRRAHAQRARRARPTPTAW